MFELGERKVGIGVLGSWGWWRFVMVCEGFFVLLIGFKIYLIGRAKFFDWVVKRM